MVVNVIEQEEPRRNVEKPKAHDNKPHHRPASERNDKPAVQAGNRPVRRAGTRVRRGFHTQKAAKPAKKASREERHRHEWILDAENG